MKIPASHVKMGAQLAEQFPAFQAEFSIYGSFEKTYNKTLRLRDFIQLVATSFGVPILAAKQTAEAVFDSRIHETITPNVPIILSAPFTYCIKCQSHLKIGRWQEVTILDADSAKSGLLYKSSCVNLSCSIQLYDVDSVSEITEGNSSIEHYPMNTIRKQNVIGINSKYYMTVAFANLWLKNVLSDPKYIQDPAVSEALQAAHEDFDYSCFQPSWGEKGRRLFPYSLHLGEYSSNQVSDNVEDLRLAMKEYVEWMNAHFAVKWKHSCGECHVVDSKGQEYSAAVMDGKVMGHLLCRVIGCNLDIIGINTKFCINHAGLKGKCIISGCANQKREGLSSS
ncbi:hypothetical protein BDR26DRAFT_1012690 [Obelidium mucronatum]|nr:hypothetical protein BDR26DRAFT_1012690 [Obelidium mucronatum]